MKATSTIRAILALAVLTFGLSSFDAGDAMAQTATAQTSTKKKTIRPVRMRAIPPRGALTDGRSFAVVNGKLTITRAGATVQAAPGRYPTSTGDVLVVDAKRRVTLEAPAKAQTAPPKKKRPKIKSKKRPRRAITSGNSAGKGRVLIAPPLNTPSKKKTTVTLTPGKKAPTKKDASSKDKKPLKFVPLKKSTFRPTMTLSPKPTKKTK